MYKIPPAFAYAEAVNAPLLAIINLVVPAADAVKRSLSPNLFTIKAACPPAFGEIEILPFPAFAPKVIPPIFETFNTVFPWAII